VLHPGLPLACSGREAELRAELLTAAEKGNAGYSPLAADPAAVRVRSDPAVAAYRDADRAAHRSYDPDKAAALFRRFAKNGTRQVPTLTVVRGLLFAADPGGLDDPRFKYLPPGVAEFWRSYVGPSRLTAGQRAERELQFGHQLELVGAMHRAGVTILAGTDSPAPHCYPGFGLHDELALLVKAGLTPMAALQAATRNAADFLGRLDVHGTIEKGKSADLLLLDANPLDKIENTQKIAAVVLDGRMLPIEQLQELLVVRTK
jgi:hypothetical protein